MALKQNQIIDKRHERFHGICDTMVSLGLNTRYLPGSLSEKGSLFCFSLGRDIPFVLHSIILPPAGSPSFAYVSPDSAMSTGVRKTNPRG